MKNIVFAILVLVGGIFVLSKLDNKTNELTDGERATQICEVSNNREVVDLCKQKRANLRMCEKEPVASEGYERCVRTHELLTDLILSF